MPSPRSPSHEDWSLQSSGNGRLSLKPRPTSGKSLGCSRKRLSCLFEGEMAHELHRPTNVYRPSEPFPEDAPKVRGYDFNRGVDHKALLQSFYNTGFQATHFGQAVREINRMVRVLKPPADRGQMPSELNQDTLPPPRPLPQIEKRKQPWKSPDEGSREKHPPHCPCRSSCTIFLGYTSNMISSGVRETIRFLAQHRMARPACHECPIGL